ncbi:hypothetical protein K504DRAFT_470058 [Pleomassaria siparia CBS 279.74]|uniref:Uncharacterized protein n=1 Tax=Pleomassaria siparia CBS 279.74 TaxID=1314801 RepID=A0A6G1K5F1_9PLEO|nr:hypothetical protein K504DRAFT_470058 [Pleomassaria siparia CBS 279.74]
MSSHTPSPHRFLAPSSQPSSTPKSAISKPPSSLRHGFTAQSQTPKPAFSARRAAETPKVTPAKRFVITPLRSLSGGGIRGGSGTQDEVGLQAELTPREKPPRKLKRVESIDEGSQSTSPGSPRGTELEREVALSIEHDTSVYARSRGGGYEVEEEHAEEDADAEMLFQPQREYINVNKRRRRLSPAEPSSPPARRPSLPNISLQVEPVSNRQTQDPRTPAPAPHTHRFLTPAPRAPIFGNPKATPTTMTTTTTTTTTTTPAPSRPHFILPSQHMSPPKLSTPLPETFSPSRKGQKYVPGGLASTLQSWIIETAHTGYAAQTRDMVIYGREKDDGVKLKVRVTDIGAGSDSEGEGEDHVECYPGGVVFAQGDVEMGMSYGCNAPRASSIVGDEGGVRVMLAGQGSARGIGGVRVRVGSLLGIRGPMWDVDVGGEKWNVGVDWVVL